MKYMTLIPGKVNYLKNGNPLELMDCKIQKLGKVVDLISQHFIKDVDFILKESQETYEHRSYYGYDGSYDYTEEWITTVELFGQGWYLRDYYSDYGYFHEVVIESETHEIVSKLTSILMKEGYSTFTYLLGNVNLDNCTDYGIDVNYKA